MNQVPTLVTISQFSKQNPAFPEGGLRWQIFNEDTNGLREAGAIIRIGRKVLIDTNRYFQWVYAGNKIVSRNNGNLREV